MLIDLSHRAIFRVTGVDRIRFLNGQLTNDVAALPPATTIYACALTAKGKLAGDLFLRSTGSTVLIDTDAELRESLYNRLIRYVISDNVEIEDASDELALIHAWDEEISDDGVLDRSTADRYQHLGTDLFLARTRLAGRAFKYASAAAVEELRITQGIPAWGSELNEDTLPDEAGINERAVSYTKGCYLGQEIISRLKSVGHVNRLLRRIVLSEGFDLMTGDRLVAADAKAAGQVTSCCYQESTERWIGLAFVRRAYLLEKLAVKRSDDYVGQVQIL